MNERTKAFLVGFFVLAALALAAWLLLFLRPTVGDGGKTLRVRFSNIEKINIGTRVTFAGKPVGEVVAINEIFDARNQPSNSAGVPYFYELVLEVDSSVKIYSYDTIVFSTSGLLGERSIAIIPKSAPSGLPSPHEITDEILYAKSTDPLNEALSQVNTVAVTFEATLNKVNDFLDNNQEEARKALISISSASEQVKVLAERANETDLAGRTALAAIELQKAMEQAHVVFGQIKQENLVPRMSRAFEDAGMAFEKFHRVGTQLATGEGSLGRLLYSDRFYLQLSNTLNRIDTTLGNINHYGLLFQYDKRWQRQQLNIQNKMRQFSGPAGFYNFFNCELDQISRSIEHVSEALDIAEGTQVPLDDPCFAKQFHDLLNQVEILQENLMIYQQKLSQDYSQKCYCQ